MSEIIQVSNSNLISPYVLTPFHTIKNQPLPPIAQAIARLTDPRDLKKNPYWKTEVGQSLIFYRNFVAAEFIRITFDKRVEVLEFRRQDSRLAKEQVKLEAELWKACWNLIGQVHLHAIACSNSPASIDPSETFLRLVLDQKLVHFISATDPDGTATDYIKRVQAENSALRIVEPENPFDRETFTGQFVSHAIALSEQSLPTQQALRDLVKTRMKFVACWKKTYPAFVGARKLEKRGRKKLGK